MKALLTLGFGLILTLLASAESRSTPRMAERAWQDLVRLHPEVKIRSGEDAGGVRIVYGAPMAGAGEPGAAAARWITDHREVFGAGAVELVVEREARLSGGRFVVFSYRQEMNGVPVESAAVRLLVRTGTSAEVVLASARLEVGSPAGSAVRISPDEAAAVVGSDPRFGHLARVRPVELVMVGPVTDRALDGVEAAYEVGVRGDGVGGRIESWTVFVSASTARILTVRNEVHEVDITGTVTGNATPGALPDVASNLPVTIPLPSIRVRVAGGPNTLTAADGTYTLSVPDTTPVSVELDLVGPFAEVRSDQSMDIFLEQTVTPPATADFLLNAGSIAFETAQVNAYRYVHLAHDFVRSRAPDFTALDQSILCTTNRNLSCGATFEASTPSISFFRANGGCVNTAYSSILVHEYGHFVVDRLGLAQGSFGEGFADALAMLLLDDPAIGRGFTGPGTVIREPLVANVQYPCTGGGIHRCGEILAAVWFRIKDSIQVTEGDAVGLETARQLFVDWAQMTIGGQGDDSAHPATVVEVLTVDDDDGNLDNGTPHFNEICDAFAQQGLDCPTLPGLFFDYPDGIPSTIFPHRPTTLRVNVLPGVEGNPIPGTGTLSLQLDGGGFQTFPLTEIAPNEYEFVLPGRNCLERIDFFVTAQAESLVFASDPVDGAQSPRSVRVSTATPSLFLDDFEGDQGWTVVNENLTDGAWERGVPQGDGTRGDPITDFDGSGSCFLTGNVNGNSDVDGGPTRLVSPAIPIGGQDVTVSYAYSLANDDLDDSLVVQVSPNAVNWTIVRTITGNSGGWVEDSFTLSDFLAPGADLYLRFNVADAPNNSITEAAVDAVRVTGFECTDLVLTHGPLIRGQSTEFIVTGAAPGTRVAVLATARGTGMGPCFPALGGLCLDLPGDPRVAGVGLADGNGELRFSIPVPVTAPLVSIALQAANRVGVGGAGSSVSNVTEATIQP